MKHILLTLSVLLLSCAKPVDSTSGDPNCKGRSGTMYTCSVGSCSHSTGTGCSAMNSDGVACCNGGGGGNDGTSNCALGWCWTTPGNLCCPRTAPYNCRGGCYTTNVCGYTSYRSACHDW